MVQIVAAAILFIFVVSTAADETHSFVVQVKCDGPIPVSMVIQALRPAKGVVTIEELLDFCAKQEEESQKSQRYKRWIRW
jgi:hypothetical protein